MPTENERKYVLRLDSEDSIHSSKPTKVVIEQGYTAFSKGMTLRVRKKQTSFDKHPVYYLTYKQKVTSRVIEIEQEIDERDFKELWELSVSRLLKIRYTFADNRSLFWEIDFLKKDGKTYFALAEVELPEEMVEPTKIPKFINKFLIYAVPLSDNRFSNKRLADSDYAKTLYETLIKEKNGK